MGSAQDLPSLLSTFGDEVAAKFRTGAGEPEDHLRGPLERFFGALGGTSARERITLAGEERLGDIRARPDFAVDAGGALVGFIEVKAPGKGADPERFRDGHDRDQWARLKSLPNLLYTDGQTWGLYRFGERVDDVVTLDGAVETAGRALAAPHPALRLLLSDFLAWSPQPPRTPKQLALTAARLCRLLRAEIRELLATDPALRTLADDWRELLFPDATDDEFADGYAQTVTFALLLARVEDVDFGEGDLGVIADRLGDRHTLIATALDLLTDERLLGKLAVSLGVLVRVLSVVDWPTLTRGETDKWLLFYEEFLQEYDSALRRQTGSYYTPNEAVSAMVRLVDDLLRDRLGRYQGLAAPDVTVVDPAIGTGTFLFHMIDRIARTVAHEEGEAAVAARLRQAAGRMVGFELQTGPYAVAEFRLAEEYRRRGARLGPEELRLYMANTLDDPFTEDVRLMGVYDLIARSRRAANEVKKAEPVLVVIGNPPYRERSHGAGGWVEQGNAALPDQRPLLDDFLPDPELGLSAHVKHLYNPYVYFWRWATWKVFERHPEHDRGVVAFVTVAGFLNGPGFVGMREHLRRTADEIWVIDLSPEGHQPPVPTRVFAGVQQPVCITIAVRDGSTGPVTPAPVHHLGLSGLRDDKFAALAELGFDEEQWRDCGTEWNAPFLPAPAESWAALPALDDLLPWSGSGTMPGRTWVCGPAPDVLRDRWGRLITAPLGEKRRLMAEHPTDRTVYTVLRDGLPGHPARPQPLADEMGTCPTPERIGYRSFDRQWIIPDKRLINRPNPSLWQVRSDRQVYLTGLSRTSPVSGPAATFSALVPDLDHYHGRGGRAFPLWRDPDASLPNVAPGLLDALVSRYRRPVTAPDVLAFMAAILAHPGFTARFAADLVQPGLRVPLTADAGLFTEGVQLGRRSLWLHTYGERFADVGAGRPARPPKLPGDRRPKVRTPIPDTPDGMPTGISYDASGQELRVGAGVIAPVPASVWDYEVSGMRVIRKWFGYRKRDPEGRRSSDLDDINAAWWEPAFTTELLEFLNVLGLLVDLEPEQEDLLERVLAAPLVTVDDLESVGVLPVTDDARRPPRATRQATGYNQDPLGST